MTKYIIEIPDDVQYVLLNGKADNKYYTAVRPIAELEELNSDYINEHFGELQDEAYQRGHDDGYEAGCATAFKPVSDAEYQRGYDEGYKKCLSVYDFDQPCISCEGYKRGLNDAWEAAKKLFSSMADSDIEKAFPIEWNNGGFKALMNLQPQEAIAKLKAYKDKQKEDDRIEVGDEVQAPCGIATVTSVEDDSVYYFYSDGDIGCIEPHHVTKTGKHYDIQSILEAMRE